MTITTTVTDTNVNDLCQAFGYNDKLGDKQTFIQNRLITYMTYALNGYRQNKAAQLAQQTTKDVTL